MSEGTEPRKLPHEDFHEIWWIYSPERHEWGGLRIAHFRKSVDGAVLVIISGETDKRRIGVRIWEDVGPREGWVKVKQIAVPSSAEVKFAIDAQLTKIASDVTKEIMGETPEQKQHRESLFPYLRNKDGKGTPWN